MVFAVGGDINYSGGLFPDSPPSLPLAVAAGGWAGLVALLATRYALWVAGGWRRRVCWPLAAVVAVAVGGPAGVAGYALSRNIGSMFAAGWLAAWTLAAGLAVGGHAGFTRIGRRRPAAVDGGGSPADCCAAWRR